jgi:cardiolipin synthase
VIRPLFATTGRLVLTVLAAVTLLAIAALVIAAWPEPPEVLRLPDVAVGDGAFPATVQGHADASVVGGNAIEVLLNGDRIFPAKIAAIRAAKRSIAYAEYFYAEGEPGALIAAALADRCRAGVAVKVLLDGVGALSMETAHRRTMEDAGCRVVTFRPIGRLTIRRNNDRNHRRILVVDGRVGITGGSGVSWKWTGDGRKADHWRDTDVRVDGPVVDQLQAAFAENWREATGEVLGGAAWFPPAQEPRGPARAHVVRSSPAAGDHGLYRLFLLAIAGSRTSLDITNPYFVPDETLDRTIRDAARRGVRVRVLVPGVIDHAIVREAGRRRYGEMMKAGVEFYEYRPALLHAKTMVVDGVWATVGSTNLDRRSFALNDELNLAVYDPGVAGTLARAFAADLQAAERVTYEAWARRPLKGRIFELISIPLAPLL